MALFEKFLGRVNAAASSAAATTEPEVSDSLPTLWLLGKTGAGKSSLIQAVTGLSSVKIGDGFRPCTQTASYYDFPCDKPLMRFLDTRGLAEAGYDAREDILACQRSTHALVVVIRAEDPEISSVLAALKQIRRAAVIEHILLVHTGVLLLDQQEERQQALAHHCRQVEAAWRGTVASVAVDFGAADGSTLGVAELTGKLAEFLPILSLLGRQQGDASAEEAHFAKLKAEILWYASASGGSDLLPVIGLGSVPVIQARMLQRLAAHYEVRWNRIALAEFITALGSGFSVQYLSRIGIRQLSRLIPVYGQTIGSATAVAISFSSTYALGRVACKYLFHKNRGEPVPEKELKRIYREAFREVRKVGESETQRN